MKILLLFLAALGCEIGAWSVEAQTNSGTAAEQPALTLDLDRPISEVHAGPAYDFSRLTLEPGWRTEIGGPFYYREQREAERVWAAPPLVSCAVNPELQVKEFDVLYPVFTYDRYGDQFRWQLFQLLSFAGGPTQEESVRNRFTVFPIYFQQRSSDPSQDYTAVFPFYGHLQHRLYRDDIFFVMFPAYSRTRKRDVVTQNYLYPFFDVHHGDGMKGWQFWPVIGREQKAVTSRTNNFGDVEKVGGHKDLFVMWPLFYNYHGGLGTTNPVWEQALLPAYALTRSPARDSTTVGWPFFSHINDRENKYREWDAPWPLIEFARGPGKTTTRVWPFFSRAHNATIEDNFYLWPVYKVERIHSEPLERRRTRIVFFLYDDIFEKNTETGRTERWIDLWPLFTRKREFDGNTRLQVFAFLEPWLHGSHKVERDWSPLWSVWRAEKNPRTGAASQSLLWNLYRRETGPLRKSISACFGLFQYRSSPTGKELRVFYIPVERREAPARRVDAAGGKE